MRRRFKRASWILKLHVNTCTISPVCQSVLYTQHQHLNKKMTITLIQTPQTPQLADYLVEYFPSLYKCVPNTITKDQAFNTTFSDGAITESSILSTNYPVYFIFHKSYVRWYYIVIPSAPLRELYVLVRNFNAVFMRCSSSVNYY